MALGKGLILGKRGLPKKASTMVSDRGRITRHILPLLGHRKVRDLKTPDINRFLRDVSTGRTAANIKTRKHGRAIVEGGTGTAARTVGLLGGIIWRSAMASSSPTRSAASQSIGCAAEVRLSDSQYRLLGRVLEAAEADGEPGKR